MRLLALGGCGSMGRHAVNTMASSHWCDNIVIADYNGNNAREFSERLGDRSSWLQVDINDKRSLNNSMKGIDVVMNTTGPYHRYGKTVLETAIESGCDYIDICDDWEPTLQMLDMSMKAKDHAATAIIGMGATPGISNMLGVKAMRELDEVTELYTGWDISYAKPEKGSQRPSAATIHGIHQLTGLISIFEEGRFKSRKPLTRVALDYPGFGSRNLYTIGHPEAVTFPRYYSTLKTCLNLFFARKYIVWGIRLITGLVNAGMVTINAASTIAESLHSSEDTKNDNGYDRLAGAVAARKELPPLFALAMGRKNGNSASVACAILSAPAGGMGGATGVPLAIGSRMLLEKKIKQPGVFAPEAIVEPDSFFENLAPLCSPKKSGAENLVLVTRSWEADR